MKKNIIIIILTIFLILSVTIGIFLFKKTNHLTIPLYSCMVEKNEYRLLGENILNEFLNDSYIVNKDKNCVIKSIYSCKNDYCFGIEKNSNGFSIIRDTKLSNMTGGYYIVDSDINVLYGPYDDAEFLRYYVGGGYNVTNDVLVKETGNDYYSLLDLESKKFVANNKYNNLEVVNNDNGVVAIIGEFNGKKGIVETNYTSFDGKMENGFIVQPIYDEINLVSDVDNLYFILYDNNKMNLLDYNNDFIFDEWFDYVGVYKSDVNDDYLLYLNNNKLYFGLYENNSFKLIDIKEIDYDASLYLNDYYIPENNQINVYTGDKCYAYNINNFSLGECSSPEMLFD